MTTTTIKDVIPCEISKVWETVSAVEQYPVWRKDVSKIEVLGEKQFTEYAKEDYSTSVAVTMAEPNRRLEFDRENNHIKGHWTFVFSPKGNETEVDFTAEVTAKQLSTRPVGKSVFEREYSKKEQEEFISDLKKKLM